jgi:hypothetical protein
MFIDITEVIPQGKAGDVEITHFIIDEHESMMSSLRGGMSYVLPGKYAKLTINNKVVMSNTRMEKMTNGDFIYHANGDVLIAGLGLGMIIFPILSRTDIKSVTVIEKNENVIALVSPHIRDNRFRVVQSDIFTWRPERGSKFDTIYFDIWNDMSIDNLAQISKLHQGFKSYLNRNNPARWMNSWCRDYLRNEKRRYGC